MPVVLRCHPGIGSQVTGTALVAKDNFSARYDLDRKEGVFSRPTHALAGQSYSGRIIVLDQTKGGVATAWTLHEMKSRGVVPLALILNRVNPILAQGAAFGAVAMVDRFVDGDVTDLIRTGDMLRLDPAAGTVEILNRWRSRWCSIRLVAARILERNAMPGFTTRPEIRGTFGVVATTHWLASSVAMSVFEKGGNAFDAAVAAGFTLQVVEPHLNGPLGEAPVLVYSAKTRRAEMICGQGVAPQDATIAHYRSLGLDLIPGTGLLAATVPGAFDAWARLARDYGTLPLAELMEPALGYAESGYPLVGRIRDTIMTVAELFRREWTTSAAVYLPSGSPPVPGKLFRNPTLAATYRRVLAESEAGGGNRDARIERARDAWYKGFVAEAIDRFCRTQKVLDASGRRHTGVLTADDMARWQAPVEAPLAYDYRGYTVVKGGPWSQGPVLLQQLALLQGFDLDDLDPVGPEFVHVVTECAKLAYADREAWYGDPDFVDVPMATLLSRDYNDIRRRLVGERASLELRPGSPDGREPYVLVGGAEVTAAAGVGEPTVGPMGGIGEPTVSELGVVAGDTCHLDIIDRWGNMVSATPSGGWLQSSPVVPELGFCLGTRLQIAWLDERSASSLAPGKRPRSTLSPTLALKDGEPFMAFGTPGGDGQDQWSTQLFLHHVHHGMNLQEAIDCPEFNNDHAPSSFYPRAANPGGLALEGRFPHATARALAERGHKVRIGETWSGGRLTACAREETPDGVILKAGANPRGMQTYAVGR